MVVTRAKLDPAVVQLGVCLLAVTCQPFVEGGTDHRSALPAEVRLPRHGRPRGQDRVGRHAGHDLDGGRHVDEDGARVDQSLQRHLVGRVHRGDRRLVLVERHHSDLAERRYVVLR
jgi:hypothetical protein